MRQLQRGGTNKKGFICIIVVIKLCLEICQGHYESEAKMDFSKCGRKPEQRHRSEK